MMQTNWLRYTAMGRKSCADDEGVSKHRALDKVHLVVTSGGSALKDRTGYQSVSDITLNKKNEDEVINSLIKKLQ